MTAHPASGFRGDGQDSWLARPETPGEIERRERMLATTPAAGPVEPTPYHDGRRLATPPDAELGPPQEGPAHTFGFEQGIYITDWPAPVHVRVEVDMLRSERSGDLTGEVSIRSTLPGLERHLHTARLTLSGTRSRSDLARHLASRASKLQDIDWPGIVEVACVRTISAYRAGEPAILLRQAPQPLFTADLLAPIVCRGLTIWFGDGGTAKSFLALAASLSIQTGTAEPLGLAATGPMACGYLDWEWDAWEHRRRAESLVAEVPDLYYLRMGGVPLAEALDRVRRFVRDTAVRFLVMDSIAWACDGPPEEADTARRFLNAIDRIGLPVLGLAHVNRDDADRSDGGSRRPFGSAFWHNGARSTWQLSRDDGQERTIVTMVNRKANAARLHPPLVFELDFGDRTVIRRLTVPDVRRKDAPVWEAMALEMRAGALTLHELAERTGKGMEAVRLEAKRGEAKGRFVRVTGADGIERWGLKARGAP